MKNVNKLKSIIGLLFSNQKIMFSNFDEVVIKPNEVNRFNSEEYSFWAVYPLNGSNEGYFIEVDAIQKNTRIPVFSYRIQDASFSEVMQMVSAIYELLRYVEVNEVFFDKKDEYSLLSEKKSLIEIKGVA